MEGCDTKSRERCRWPNVSTILPRDVNCTRRVCAWSVYFSSLIFWGRNLPAKRRSLLHQQICLKFRPARSIYLQENSSLLRLPYRHFHTQHKQWGFCMEDPLPDSEARTALQWPELQSKPEWQTDQASAFVIWFEYLWDFREIRAQFSILTWFRSSVNVSLFYLHYKKCSYLRCFTTVFICRLSVGHENDTWTKFSTIHISTPPAINIKIYYD